jgi:hypothetical protein
LSSLVKTYDKENARDRLRMRIEDWVFAFVHGFRYESRNMNEDEKSGLRPFLKEQTLAPPCQAEIAQFTNPKRVVFLFFFDSTKQDFLIDNRKLRWEDLESVVEILIRRYSSLEIRPKDLLTLMSNCRDIRPDSWYSIDFIKDVCCVCFTRDPRNRGCPLPWIFNYIIDPQELAKNIFDLNLSQALTYF